MSAKSQQLQIRVTPAQKAVLKRLAGRAGQGVSAYVLARALPPPAGERFRELVALLADEAERRFALAELNAFLTTTPRAELAKAVADAPLTGVPPLFQNYVAAMVEMAAHRKGVPAPAWTRDVEPLAEPYFASDLPGLRLHLLRASPVPFRRRNLFVDSSLGDRV